MGKYAASAAYCGGYSYASGGGANAKCYLLYGADDPAKNDNDAPISDTLDACYKSSHAKDFFTKATAIKTAYDTLTATSNALHTAMVAETDVQAGLESNWLAGWYLQQYWVAINLELDPTTANS